MRQEFLWDAEWRGGTRFGNAVAQPRVGWMIREKSRNGPIHKGSGDSKSMEKVVVRGGVPE